MTLSHSAVVWDLSHVLPSHAGPTLDALLADLESKVKLLEGARSRLDAIAEPSELDALVNLDAEIGEICARLGSYGELRFAADTGDEEAKSFMAKMDDLTTEVGNRTRFLDLWWKTIPDARAEKLMSRNPEIAHYLRFQRLLTPHTLTEPEERIIAIKDITGATAVDRVREMVTTSLKFVDPVSRKVVNQSELMRNAYDPKPEVREATYQELWRVYGEQSGVLSYLYQTVITDWSNEQLKLRKFPTPISVRNKGNEIPDAAVETLLEVCKANREVFQRYFVAKAKKLGIPPSRYHIYAPLRSEKVEIGYDASKARVLDLFDRFSPEIGREARKVFDERHVHAFPAPTKRGGAFCSTVTSKMTPYVFLNFTGDHQSLKTMAHEMGHAVHSLLARDRHPLVAHATLPMCETASVFAEMLLHGELLREATPAQRVALLSDKLGEAYATVMRQAYFTKFEIVAHDLVREGATAEDLSKAYAENLREQFGPVEVPDAFRLEWTYIPHLYASPFYCYAYSFGMLLSLALYAKYTEEGPSFVPKYTRLLATGGAEKPADMLAKIGVDIADRKFWQKGFNVLDDMERDLEAALKAEG